jgi:glycosyltransferase involved in cell wall biosynthesis
VERVTFLVNGSEDGPAGVRARAFAGRLADRYEAAITYRLPRKVRAIAEFLRVLHRTQPHIVYVLDLAYSGVIAAALHAWSGRPRRVVDTGDPITALAKSVGERGWAGELLTMGLEQYGLRSADTVVVRGTFHREILARQGIRAEVVQDGVDVEQFRPLPADRLRAKLGLDGVISVAMLGSSIWSKRLKSCAGWELVELVRLFKDAPVKGVLIGDGSGIPFLRERCRQYGIEDQIVFTGRVPYEALPEHLCAVDVCLSTQSNDLVGQVRTTGKLPLYMATGRYVLASRVGEASLVLPDEMLVDYEGVVDRSYPGRLAERLRALLAAPSRLRAGAALVPVARERFAYSVLADRVRALLQAS